LDRRLSRDSEVTRSPSKLWYTIGITLMRLTGSLAALALLLADQPWFAHAQTPAADRIEFFEKRIRPIFANRCQGCHNASQRTAGLDLTSAAGFRRGGDSGPILDLAIPGNSRLLQVISYIERTKMPPTDKLAAQEIALLQEWVKSGAPWPDAATEPASPGRVYSRAQRELWAFKPVKRPAPPKVDDPQWQTNAIDSLILSRLRASGLTPAPSAGALTLLRRATYDLTGLPPTEQEVRAFLADPSDAAYEKLIERLLASRRYGERWGRHWLDVARYADSTGADEDHRYPHAWRYRDYVIDAFNRDLPYNQFIREQIAGDLMPASEPGAVNKQGIIATGFLALGPKLIAEQDKVKMFYDIVDEQIEVTGKAILGLTIACARCHDHKFDPISTRDYYSLASIFASTKQLAKLEGTVSKLYFAPLVPKEIAGAYEAHQAKIEDKQREIAELTAEEARRHRDELAPRLTDYMLAARAVYAGGAVVAQVARERALDQAVLERWVAYLKPAKERRVHLEPWHHTQDASINAAAKRYQTEFLATAAERNRAHLEWKGKAAAARQRGQEPPEAPKFQPGDNRFFTEVTAADGPFGLPKENKEQFFAPPARTRAAALDAELKQLKETAPPEPPLACGLSEGKIVEQHVFLRGNPESRGEIAPKRFPVVLAGEEQPPISSGSGRRELADWLASPRNPLTARVMVNRIWQGHFGEGLVRTASNFGVTGERPTHPKLLDWLAAEFIARGWSVKAMHRLIMLSRTYRMSSEATPQMLEVDAGNRLLARFSMRRLAVEEIRDSLLMLDGSLDVTMGGTLQTGEGTDKEFSEDRKSLNPENSMRRTIYLPLRRSNLPRLFTTFDFGDATTSNELRTQTNVAPQALYMMNSPFVAERANRLAEKLLQEPDAARRVEQAWFSVLGRPPNAREVNLALEYVTGFPDSPVGDSAPSLVWSSFCRSLMGSNEFMYVH
jgi:hypothetical protein